MSENKKEFLNFADINNEELQRLLCDYLEASSNSDYECEYGVNPDTREKCLELDRKSQHDLVLWLNNKIEKVKELKKELKSEKCSTDFYKIRVEEIEIHMSLFQEPYLTYLCNILANGKIDVKEP